MMRIDSTAWKGTGFILGINNFGIPAQDIPADGENGPSPLYNYLTFPADNDVLITWYITRWPTNGTLTAYDDGSFSYIGEPDSFDYDMFKDGVLFLQNTVNLNEELSLTVIKSELALSGKTLFISAGFEVDLEKSTVNIVGKNLSLIAGSVLNIEKSTLNIESKTLSVVSGTGFNESLQKSQLNIVSKDLVFESVESLDLQKSTLNVSVKTLNIVTGHNLDLVKSSLSVNSKVLSLGTVAISLPADRIFTIPTQNFVFSVPIPNVIIKM